MTRARLAAVAVALALLGAILLRQAAPGASARPSEPAEREAPSPAPRTTPPIPAPARDIFTYTGDDDDDAARPTAFDARPAALPPPPSLADPTPPPAADGPRLVGILRQAGGLKAALSLDGEVLIVRVGERAGPFTVLAIDEEEGVRLQDPAGATVTLSPH